MALETHTISLAHLTLSPDELAFYKTQSGIDSEEKLKERIAEIAQKALDVSFELVGHSIIQRYRWIYC